MTLSPERQILIDSLDKAVKLNRALKSADASVFINYLQEQLTIDIKLSSHLHGEDFLRAAGGVHRIQRMIEVLSNLDYYYDEMNRQISEILKKGGDSDNG